MITNVEFWGPNEVVDGGMRISWSYMDIGFGQLDIVKDKNGTIRIDSEYMGKNFVHNTVLLDLVDRAVID